MNGPELLEHAAGLVNRRRREYGEPVDLFEQVAQRWSLTLRSKVSPAQVVLCLIDLKLARLARDPKHLDSQIDVEGAVLDHVQKLLAAPELVARIWAMARREDDEIPEREVTVLIAEFATVWNELFPAEQVRIVQLLVERVDLEENALEVRIRAEGLASLVGELRQGDERTARAA
jgi:Domain of unknown function (DUF6378)